MKYKNIELPSSCRQEAYKFIKDIINNFDKDKKLNSLDSLSLYMLCDAINTYLDCEQHIKEEGYTIISDRGNTSLSPYIVIQKQVQSQINVLIKELGLSIKSRSSIKLADTAEEESPLMKFIATNK